MHIGRPLWRFRRVIEITLRHYDGDTWSRFGRLVCWRRLPQVMGGRGGWSVWVVLRGRWILQAACADCPQYRSYPSRETIGIEFSRQLVEMARDWSGPIEARFVQSDSGEWDLQTRKLS